MSDSHRRVIRECLEGHELHKLSSNSLDYLLQEEVLSEESNRAAFHGYLKRKQKHKEIIYRRIFDKISPNATND